MKYKIFYNKKLSPFLFGHMGKPESEQDISKWYRNVHEVDMKGDIKENLDNIFVMFNRYSINPLSGEKGQKKVIDLGIGHTSMSVGDIVKVDDTIYYCDREGWTPMSLPKRTPVKLTIQGKRRPTRPHWVDAHNKVSKKGKMFRVNEYRRLSRW